MSFLLDTDTCSAHLKTAMLTDPLIQHGGRLQMSVDVGRVVYVGAT